MLGRLILIDGTTSYENLTEVRIDCEAESGTALPHRGTLLERSLSGNFILHQFNSIFNSLGAFDVVSTTDHEEAIARQANNTLQEEWLMFLLTAGHLVFVIFTGQV